MAKLSKPSQTNTTNEEKEMPKTEETSVPTAIEKTVPEAIATTGHSIIDAYAHIPAFVERYGKPLLRIEAENVSSEVVDKTLWSLPEEMQDKLFAIIAKMNPQKKGVVTDSGQTDFLEIRLNQGTGNDQNRPEDSVSGHYYLSSVEKIGKSFLATPLLIWEGRQMWEQRGDDAKGPNTPECTSLDRHMGDHYGACEQCPYLPWRDNKPSRCGNTVTAILLIKDSYEIAMLRFQRTSTPAGTQLVKFAKRGTVPWARWYKFEAEVQTKGNDKRWFIIKAAPTDEVVDKDLQKFCDVMCTVAERDYFYPRVARQYSQKGSNSTPALAATTAPDPNAPTTVTDENMGDFGNMKP
jgi:hypothetical protein